MVVSEYETQRLRNITENQIILKNLGLHADVEQARAQQESLRAKREEKKALKRKWLALADGDKKGLTDHSSPPPPARRSRRTRALAPDYSERQRVFGEVKHNDSVGRSESYDGNSNKKKRKQSTKSNHNSLLNVKQEKKQSAVVDLSEIWAPQAETRQRWELHVANAQQHHKSVKTEYCEMSMDMLQSIDARDIDAQSICGLPQSGASQDEWQTCAVKRWGALVGSGQDSPVEDWAAFVMSRLPQPLLGLDLEPVLNLDDKKNDLGSVKSDEIKRGKNAGKNAENAGKCPSKGTKSGEKSSKSTEKGCEKNRKGKMGKFTDVKEEEEETSVTVPTSIADSSAAANVTLPALSPIALMQELFRGDVWQLLVSCALMSRVASAPLKERVIKAFFKHYPTPTSALRGDMAHMAAVLAPLGLFPTRYRSVMEVSQRFVEVPVFDIGLIKKVNKVYGFGEFGVDSYEIFCRGKGAKMMLPSDSNLRAFCMWLRRQQQQDDDDQDESSGDEEED